MREILITGQVGERCLECDFNGKDLEGKDKCVRFAREEDCEAAKEKAQRVADLHQYALSTFCQVSTGIDYDEFVTIREALINLGKELDL